MSKTTFSQQVNAHVVASGRDERGRVASETHDLQASLGLQAVVGANVLAHTQSTHRVVTLTRALISRALVSDDADRVELAKKVQAQGASCQKLMKAMEADPSDKEASAACAAARKKYQAMVHELRKLDKPNAKDVVSRALVSDDVDRVELAKKVQAQVVRCQKLMKSMEADPSDKEASAACAAAHKKYKAMVHELAALDKSDATNAQAVAISALGTHHCVRRRQATKREDVHKLVHVANGDHSASFRAEPPSCLLLYY